MKTVLLACVGVLMVSGPAWACRGTAEFPDVQAKLAMADLPESVRTNYSERLLEGIALHEMGHEEDSMELRLKSLEILDELKIKLGM